MLIIHKTKLAQLASVLKLKPWVSGSILDDDHSFFLFFCAWAACVDNKEVGANKSRDPIWSKRQVL